MTFPLADLLANRRSPALDEIPHRPRSGAFADVVEEVLKDLLAARRVRHLRMKLHAVKRPARMPRRREWARRRRRQRNKILPAVHAPDRRGSSKPSYPAASPAPADRPTPHAISPAQTPAPWPASPARREFPPPTASRSKSPGSARPDRKYPDRIWAHSLHKRCRPAGENDPLGIHFRQFRRRNIRANQFAIDPFFAHPPRDQLGILRTEIEDGNDFVVEHPELIPQALAECKMIGAPESQRMAIRWRFPRACLMNPKS